MQSQDMLACQDQNDNNLSNKDQEESVGLGILTQDMLACQDQDQYYKKDQDQYDNKDRNQDENLGLGYACLPGSVWTG